MSFEDRIEDLIEQVNERARVLMYEFKDHVDEVQSAYPEATDARKIFEGWAIQKLAGLQVLLEAQAVALGALLDDGSGNGNGRG